MTYNPHFGYDLDQVLSTITPEKHAFRLAQVLHCMQKWAKAHPAATAERAMRQPPAIRVIFSHPNTLATLHRSA